MCGQFSLQEGFTSIWDRWADLEISAENLVHYVKCNMTANVLNQQSLARVESELRLRGWIPPCKDHGCKDNSGCKDKILSIQKVPNEGLL